MRGEITYNWEMKTHKVARRMAKQKIKIARAKEREDFCVYDEKPETILTS